MNKLPIIIVLIILIGTVLYLATNKSAGNFKSDGLVAQNNANINNNATNNPSPIKFDLPAGYSVNLFASGIDTARDLVFSPGGSLLVSSPNSGTVLVLTDKNQDNVADANKVIISGENKPHGLAFYDKYLFVASVDKVVRYLWDENSLSVSNRKVLFSLPDNRNHDKRTIVIDDKGVMYVSVGSTCNVCKETSEMSGTIIMSDIEGKNPVVFAKGQRNAPFIQINPLTGELWATGMGRDNLGDRLPPDEINIIKQGKDYGWPNCYGNKVPDRKFNADATCDMTESPIYEVPAHNAPLGLVFVESGQFPEDWQGDLLVAYHGSWNSTVPVGYKVAHLKVKENSITEAEDFMTGFIRKNAISGFQAYGRPVDLAFDSRGSLYISDDKTGNIYIVRRNK